MTKSKWIIQQQALWTNMIKFHYYHHWWIGSIVLTGSLFYFNLGLYGFWLLDPTARRARIRCIYTIHYTLYTIHYTGIEALCRNSPSPPPSNGIRVLSSPLYVLIHSLVLLTAWTFLLEFLDICRKLLMLLQSSSIH